MKHLFDSADDSGDFSTSFGDMVFGLLFFFFVLSLIMVFNRPDVSQFQEQQDRLMKEVNEQKLENSKLQREIDLAGAKVERLKNEKQELFNEVSDSTKKLAEKEKTLSVIDQEKNNLDFRYRKLREKYYEQPDDTNKLKSLERDLEMQQELNKSLREDLKKLKDDYELTRQQLDSTESMLKQKGYQKVLAELEELKKGKNAKPTTKGEDKGASSKEDGSSEVAPPEIVRLYVKILPNKVYSVRVMSGNNEIVSEREVTEEDVLRLAREARKDFIELSKNLSKDELNKNQPRIFLTAHPDTPYGSFEIFLRKIRNILPVKILEWNTDVTGPQ